MYSPWLAARVPSSVRLVPGLARIRGGAAEGRPSSTSGTEAKTLWRLPSVSRLPRRTGNVPDAGDMDVADGAAEGETEGDLP